jgi:hypothetical protein
MSGALNTMNENLAGGKWQVASGKRSFIIHNS